MGFKITIGKGFHVTFENGYTVSVQFGPGNYCQHHGRGVFASDWFAENYACGKEGSADAEVAVWASDGNLIQRPDFDGDTVQGYVSPEYVLKLMNWAAKQKKK